MIRISWLILVATSFLLGPSLHVGEEANRALGIWVADPPSSHSSSESSWILLRDGDSIEPGPGRRLKVLCPDGTCRFVTAPKVVDEGLCDDSFIRASCVTEPAERSAETRALSGRSMPRALPQEGREAMEVWMLRASELRVVGRARSEDERGYRPELISPRCSRLDGSPRCDWLEGPRRLVFFAVADAESYRFELSGARPFDPLEVDVAGGLECDSRPELGSHQVCSVAWPADWHLPENGIAVLRAKVEVDGKTRSAARPTLLRRHVWSDGSTHGSAADFLAAPEAGSLDQVRRFLVLGAAGLTQELFADLLQEPRLSNPLRVVLAQTLFELDLAGPARFLFEDVLRPACGGPRSSRLGAEDRPQVRLEALLGTALAAYELDERGLAETYLVLFDRAVGNGQLGARGEFLARRRAELQLELDELAELESW